MQTLATFFFIVMMTPVFSQTRISGKVTDASGEGIPGANLSIKDSYDGASSALDGSFSFTSDEKGSHTLVISFVGYKAHIQPVELTGKEIVLNIVLKEEINQLDGVVISAGSFTAGEEKRRTILKPVDIAMTAGATADIAGALNTLPGTQKVGETGRLFVRGGDGSETRTFIDGMVVLDAYGPSAPNTPSRGRFMPFMFKGTSFSTGGYSAEYGQALSSALVLNSKDKAEMNQTDIGILSVGADVAHTQVWDRASVSGKVQYTNIRPYFNLINQKIDWKTPPASLEASAAYRQQVGKTGMMKFYGNFNQTDYSLYNHDILDPSLKQQLDLTNRYRYINGSYQQEISSTWSVRGGLSYSYNQNNTKTEGVPATETEAGLHSKFVFEHSFNEQLELRFGSEYFYRNYEASRFNTILNRDEAVSFTEPLLSTFAEAEYFASNKFVVKAGARFESNQLNNQNSVDPRVSLAYKPGKHGQFAVAYGTFRQTPVNQYVRVNQQVSPEKAEHFILNYQVITDRKTFRVETYYKRYNQLIKYPGSNPYQITNEGSGYAKGLDIFWRDSETIKNVDYWVSYSYLNTERDYLNYPHSAVPSFASAHNFSVVYKHFVPKIKSQLGFTYSYTSGRPYYDPNQSQDKFNTSKTPYYSDLSANIAYLPKNNLIIYFSCTNLLGRDNIFGYEYSTLTNVEGVYVGRAIRQAAPRFLFLGVFITLSKNKSINQLPNL
ncbi:MAG TPA: TonB-dependent receptor [Cyclobacteriaceae bacterium]|jgi:hypothetical protein|nr:TonB-dependent receptor [Cyclobacteriaceae bacterium]HRF34017.1 TonB-dependent receptor [Cyclobacteriaceae bacterium]